MEKWEYKIAQEIDQIHQVGALDKFGADGWELVGFDGRGIAFFKRPLADSPPKPFAKPITKVTRTTKK